MSMQDSLLVNASHESVLAKEQVSDLRLQLKGSSIGNVVFLMLGIGSSIVTKAGIISLDYFDHYLPPGSDVAFNMPLYSYMAGIITSALMIKYPESLSFWVKLYVTNGVMICLCISIPLCVYWSGGSSIAFPLFVVQNVMLGSATMVFHSCCSGYANLFIADTYNSTFLSGCALSGTLTGALRMICLSVLPKHLALSSMLFYLLAAIMLILILLTSIYFVRTPYALLHSRQGFKVLVNNYSQDKANYNLDFQLWLKLVNLSICKRQVIEQTYTKRQILSKIKKHILMIYLICLVSFCLYPGLVLLKHYPNLNDSWDTVFVTVNFETSDAIGKLLTVFGMYNHTCTSIGVYLRFFFIVMIMFLLKSTRHLADLFWVMQVTVSLLGLTSGYLQAAQVNLAPRYFNEQKARKMVGYMVVFAIFSGVFSGIIIENFLKKMV